MLVCLFAGGEFLPTESLDYGFRTCPSFVGSKFVLAMRHMVDLVNCSFQMRICNVHIGTSLGDVWVVSVLISAQNPYRTIHRYAPLISWRWL